MDDPLGFKGREWFFILLFVLSGSSGLIYQVVWARKLQLAFGVSIFAVSAVLAAYFLGMAIGAAVGGRYSDEVKRPLLVYGLIEVGIAVASLVVTPYVERLDVVLRPVNGLLQDRFWLLQSARFTLSLAILIVPTALLGATVPFISRGLISTLDRAGSRMASLYAANTLGAVAGVLLAGFYLIERVGLDATARLAAGVSLLVGVSALWAQSGDPVMGLTEQTARGQNPAGHETPVPTALLLFVMGASGAMGLGLEVLWTRILVQVMGATAYVFATVLAIFLIGIAFGSYCVRFAIDRWSHPTAKLGLCEALAALFTLLGIPVLTWVAPPAVRGLFGMVRAFGSEPGQWMFGAWLLTGAVTLLPMSIALGATFPLATRLISHDRKSIGGGIGKLYAVNTYGGVIGALGVGYMLIPRIGVYATLITIALIQAALAMILAYRIRASGWVITRHIAIPVSLVVVVALLLPRHLVDARILARIRGKVVEYREDYYGSVVLSEEGTGDQKYKRLSVNGMSYSGTAPYAMRYMRLQGHLPMIMYPGIPKNALVICFGVGLTAGSISLYPQMHLTVVELSQAILSLSDRFEDVNERVQKATNVRIVVEDGRNFLLRNSDQRFDVVTLEPPPPSVAGMANLYSRDFYMLVRDHLNANGVAAQWIPVHTQTEADTKMLLATFLSVFPNSTLWWTETGETLVIGSLSLKPLPPGHMGNVFGIPAVKRSLGEIGIYTPLDLARYFMLDADGIHTYVAGGSTMTDDLPVIEYRMPKMNRFFKETLSDMLAYQPAPHEIARLLGLPAAEAQNLQTARMRVREERMSQTGLH